MKTSQSAKQLPQNLSIREQIRKLEIKTERINKAKLEALQRANAQSPDTLKNTDD